MHVYTYIFSPQRGKDRKEIQIVAKSSQLSFFFIYTVHLEAVYELHCSLVSSNAVSSCEFWKIGNLLKVDIHGLGRPRTSGGPKLDLQHKMKSERGSIQRLRLVYNQLLLHFFIFSVIPLHVFFIVGLAFSSFPYPVNVYVLFFPLNFRF